MFEIFANQLITFLSLLLFISGPATAFFGLAFIAILIIDALCSPTEDESNNKTKHKSKKINMLFLRLFIVFLFIYLFVPIIIETLKN